MSRPFKLLLALIALGLVAAPVTAQAWLFSADVLVRKVGVARRNLKVGEARLTSLEVRGRLELFGEDAIEAAAILGDAIDQEAPGITLPATASYKFPGRCRFEARGASRQRLTASSDGARNAFEGGDRPLDVLEMFADIACPLLDGRGGYEGPSSLVRRAGVKRNVVTLGRAERQHIAYVVGATPMAESASSLWVSKETFQPLRFVDRRAAAPREIRFIDYDSPAAGRWHPRRIEFFQEGRLIGIFSIDEATPNPKLPDAIF